MTTSISRMLPSELFPGFGKLLIGFDDKFDRLYKDGLSLTNGFSSNSNYPPYNIIKNGDDGYAIQIALAGFTEKEIDITVEKNRLTVSGNVENSDTESRSEILFRGIANRSFSRSFLLDENIIVESASMINGMLVIRLQRVIPDELKPRKIEVKRVSESSFLTE